MTRVTRPFRTASEIVAVDARPMLVTIGGQDGKFVEFRNDA